MAHWRTMLKSENFCAADLWDDKTEQYLRIAVKIVKVAQGEVVGKKGRKKGMPFLWLTDRQGRELRAPFGANATNATTISNLLGTPDAKRWSGRWIGLYVTKVDGPDGMVDAIRIHPKPIETSPGVVAAPGEQRDARSEPATDGDTRPPTEDEQREILERERQEFGR